MLVRGFAAESFGDGGSALTKNCRPSSFRTLAICAFAPFAKNDAKKMAQKASVVRISPAVIAVRLVIPLARSTVTPVWPGSCLGEGDKQSWNLLRSRQFSPLTFYRQCCFRTRAPTRTVYPKGGRPAVAHLGTPRTRERTLSPVGHGSGATPL